MVSLSSGAMTSISVLSGFRHCSLCIRRISVSRMPSSNCFTELTCMVRITLFLFSTAFNMVQPVWLAEELSMMRFDRDLVARITGYLTDRLRYIRLKHCLSDVMKCNTGTPKGTVLPLFLFILYTSDFCYNSSTCHLHTFSDESSIVGCITDNNKEEYRELIQNFVGSGVGTTFSSTSRELRSLWWNSGAGRAPKHLFP